MILHSLWGSAFAQFRTLFHSNTSRFGTVLEQFASECCESPDRAGLRSLQSAIHRVAPSHHRHHKAPPEKTRSRRARPRTARDSETRPRAQCPAVCPLRRRPPSHQLTHTRHSGRFFLNIIAHPQFGFAGLQSHRTNVEQGQTNPAQPPSALGAGTAVGCQNRLSVHFDRRLQGLLF